jgi:transcriptional regulator with XRE-family HTH domain
LELRRLVGANIRAMRKKTSLTQEQVAERAAMSYKHLGEIERGAVNASLDSLLSIADALNVEVVRLFLKGEPRMLSEADLDKIKSSLATLSDIFEGTASNP